MAKPKDKRFRCPGCRKLRPLMEIKGVEIEYDPLAPPPMMCEECRTGGKRALPVQIDEFANLLIAERRLVLALTSGRCHTVKAAAKEAQISYKRAQGMISGERKPIVRAAYQRVLEEAGLTPTKMAKRLNEALDAKKQQWNPKKGRWDPFPDHNVRLNAIKTAAGQLDLAEPEEKGKGGGGGGGIVINTVVTNLLGAAPEQDSNSFSQRAAAAKDVTPRVPSD